MRGVAVLAVLLFHYQETIFPMGFLGVDIFFVISGFVVTPMITQALTGENLRERLHGLRQFYQRRFFRLAPALGTTLLLSCVIVLLLAGIDVHGRFAKQGIATLLLIGNFGAYKYAGDYFHPMLNPLVHTWSLSVEEQMYLVIPITLFVALLLVKNFKKFLPIFYLVVTLSSLFVFLNPLIVRSLYLRLGMGALESANFYLPLSRLWEFCIGGLAFVWSQKIVGRYTFMNKFRGVSWAFLLVCFIPKLNISGILWTLLVTFITVLFLAFGSNEGAQPNFVRCLSWVGDRSYSIYLLHMPLLFIGRYSPLFENSTHRLIVGCMGCFGSIALGSIMYSKIEQKFRRNYNEHSKNHSSLAICLSVVAPSLFLMIIVFGTHSHYWGFDKNPIQPPYAADLDPNCHRDNVLGSPCIYMTDGSKGTVLLVGDSHAGHLSQAFVDAAHKSDLNAVVWVQSACPFIAVSNFLYSERFGTACMTHNREIVDYVVANRPVQVYVSEGVSNLELLDPLVESVALLKRIGTHPVVIGQTPVFTDPRFMNSGTLFQKPYSAPKKFAISDFASQRSVDMRLASVYKTRSIDYVDVWSIFCQRSFCSRWGAKINGKEGWLYRDESHLSPLGGELLLPALEGQMQKHEDIHT